jgi:hypothetical protein
VSTATLHGYGRVAWADLAAALAGTQTAWADYDGFHIGDCPAQAPPYTHLWAWSSGWLLRARIDGDTAVVGALLLTATAVPLPSPLITEQVNYVMRKAQTWDPGERRVGPLSAAVTERVTDLYEVAGPQPVTFIGLR